MAELLLELEWPADAALRIMLTGGDVLHRRPAPGTPFTLVNNYGVTEATVVSTSGVVAPERARACPSIGRSIAGTRAATSSARTAAPVPDGEPGELFIGGRGVAIGYFEPSGTDRRAVRPDPFSDEPGARMYRTGDLARVADDGDVQFLGRIDEARCRSAVTASSSTRSPRCSPATRQSVTVRSSCATTSGDRAPRRLRGAGRRCDARPRGAARRTSPSRLPA